ncbi:MAG: hypothetical protein V8S96_02845 [Lachnospiraceae bacterium]
MQKAGTVREKTGLDEAVVTGKARIGEQETVLGVMDGRFSLGSMERLSVKRLQGGSGTGDGFVFR